MSHGKPGCEDALLIAEAEEALADATVSLVALRNLLKARKIAGLLQASDLERFMTLDAMVECAAARLSTLKKRQL